MSTNGALNGIELSFLKYITVVHTSYKQKLY